MQVAAGCSASSAGQVAKSMAGHRANRPSDFPNSIPPPARRSAAAVGGIVFRTPQSVMPQFIGQGSQGSGAVDDPASFDLLHRRVVPPIGLTSQDFIADGTQDDAEEEIPGAMNSGSYFSNLMSSVPFFPPVQHDAVQPDDDIGAQNMHQGAAKGRSKSYSVDEDTLLVSAWLNVSLDPIQGVDQSRSTYWKRIYDYFHANKTFDSDRTQGSLMNRWSGIQHDVNAFAGCLSRIETRNQSGCTVDDKIASACTMFKAEDRLHRNFPYMHCWKILKDKPKWIDRKQSATQKPASKKQKTSPNATPSSAPAVLAAGHVGETQASDGAQVRPPGKKTEKAKLRQRSSMEVVDYLVAKKKEVDAEKDLKKEERCQKAFALQEERIKFEKEHFEFKRQLEEDRIMNIDLSTLSYKQQQYYEARQNEILAKRCNS
ncbi:hypothetical protein EJB05_29116 [Eragrostis curvula]|uniref:No apical meristem-associated C-terminal domain-containing protein n=1 Tax=Eragrostis curvula TaxID=38414 RepID=A0A5J9US32_9POAL|nr:hypothetical protein EJB05_29116 [Eragrostis curvula]